MKVYGVIYKVTNLINGKMYIGQTVDLIARKANHISSSKKKIGFALHSAINKYGEENFNWSIIDHAYSEDELDDKECFWIDYYKTFRDFGMGYNLTTGGDRVRFSQETRMKISIANRGENSAWWGKKHSEETKRKIGLGQLGKKYSNEAKKKISDSRKMYVGENHPMYGKKHSDTTRKKMRENHADFKGGKHPKAKAVVQLTIDGEFVAEYLSSKDGAEAFGKNRGSNIASCCRGTSNTAYGFRWMFKSDYENLKEQS